MPKDMSDKIVEVIDVKRYYQLKGEEVKALDGISLGISRSSYVAILGPSGSGKSTLFNMIGGLDQPTSGEVRVDGVDIGSLAQEELAYMRCLKIGYIFQTYNLIPVMTALQNVAIPMAFAGLEEQEATDKACGLLDLVGLGDRLDHIPSELSGGQQQRVAIARALANDPSIILADEPTGNLDLVTGEDIINLLRSLCSRFGVTVVSVTHDYKMMSVSDWIVWIQDGKLDRIEWREDLEIREGHL